MKEILIAGRPWETFYDPPTEMGAVFHPPPPRPDVKDGLLKHSAVLMSLGEPSRIPNNLRTEIIFYFNFL